MLFDCPKLSKVDRTVAKSIQVTNIRISIFIPLERKRKTKMLLGRSKIKKILIVGVIALTLLTCKTDTYDVIPNVPFTVVLSSNEVLAIGNNTAITNENGGFGGLIIYNTGFGEFQAMDRICTNYPADTAKVVLDKSTLIATCPKCKSAFQINLLGQVNKGPAKYSLKQYRTSYDGVRLTISN